MQVEFGIKYLHQNNAENYFYTFKAFTYIMAVLW